MEVFILSGAFLGWSLGSNNAGNVFGTAVATRTIRYRTAIVLIAIFVVAGAALQGGPGLERVGDLAEQDIVSASVACIIAAATVTVMTMLRPTQAGVNCAAVAVTLVTPLVWTPVHVPALASVGMTQMYWCRR